jgi:hypothetical protein
MIYASEELEYQIYPDKYNIGIRFDGKLIGCAVRHVCHIDETLTFMGITHLAF